MPARTAPRAAGAARRPRLYVLDGLRLIAALSVVSFHWAGVNIHPEVWGSTPRTLMPSVHRVASYGWMGVQLFFLISGFVICMSCWGRSPRDYFTSRVVRLYPAYWVGIVITTLVVNFAATVRASRKPMSISDVLTNLTMLERPLGVTEADGVYWTLWIELRFYLLFAVVAVMGLTYRRVLAFCGIWTILAVITPSADSKLMDTVFMPQDAPYFIAGVAMYLIYRFGVNPLLLGVVAFSWLLAQNRLHITVGGYEYEVHHTLSWPVMAAVSAGAFLVMLAAAMGALNWIRWKWLTVAGALTYPVYLLHQELGWAMIRWGRNHGIAPFPLLALCLTAVLLLSWLVHRFAERPLSAALKRLLDGAKVSLPKSDPPVRSR
ncbi:MULTISPECIES: acyltransferase family protein [unclassified Streptomyces]|uniref:acyltransferase family protein n=1 Tax=unclassified Streptomyces TaxID=2593676 RepID=UPI002E2F1F58|nr:MULTISPECIES: acyltransferase [unclassified Streptomyces]WUC66181.1 acyltransferase [Streptomyces sp. NBC_00539]